MHVWKRLNLTCILSQGIIKLVWDIDYIIIYILL